jgi:putative GTP pyrophosphokinase
MHSFAYIQETLPTSVMAFAPVPNESKGSINRAAQALVEEQFTDENYDLVNRWRACHTYPINTFQATLRDKLRRKFKSYIVAQRLKRFDTIIGKLRDDPRLSLTTMQDIGGVRAILRSRNDVFKLRNEYLNSPHFSTMIEAHSCKDYITNPKASGYRGVHIIFKYKNTLNPSYWRFRVM